MRTITVFDDGSNYTMRWLRGLVWAERELMERGFRLVFNGGKTLIPRKLNGNKEFLFDDLKESIARSHKLDIVFLAFHHGRQFYKHSDSEIIELLKMIKSRCNYLVWLDTADSTGTPKFQYLPYVDKYLKKQILKDRKRYLSPIWGGRIHCDYYHNLLGVNDEEVEKDYYDASISETEIEKIGVSWNVGCGDLFGGSFAKQLLHPFNYAHYDFISPSSEKMIDIHFRGSAWSPIAGYQRRKTIEILSSTTGLSIPDVTKKIPHEEYVRELQSAKMVCSPFGWGEICTRDFEAFLYGATLIKPSMEHMITFPNWYIKNETYVPLSWDFSDFSALIDKVKDHDIDSYKIIAENGQQMYHDIMMSTTGRKQFAKHLIEQLTL